MNAFTEEDRETEVRSSTPLVLSIYPSRFETFCPDDEKKENESIKKKNNLASAVEDFTS
jgi:hypothetical protein